MIVIDKKPAPLYAVDCYKGNKKDFPSQCNSCVRMEYCLKTGCIKSKDCKSKLITDKSYAESLAEIRRE